MNTPASPSEPALPLVVQVAFAGNRRLLDPKAHAPETVNAFEAAVGERLTACLKEMPARLKLSTRHHLCGLSSLAIGADRLFTLSCQTLGWWQRIFLPQPREDFLSAQGSEGPDFTPDEAAAMRTLLGSPHVIEERVVSTSSNRHRRFEDVNLELVRVCDVVVCVLAAEAGPGLPGGTSDVLALARRWHRPALEIRVTWGSGGALHWQETWHPNSPPGRPELFLPPSLPSPLNRIQYGPSHLQDAAGYRAALKNFATAEATRRQSYFKSAALFIVGAHVLATALALSALKLHGSAVLPWFLGVELALLAAGLGYHEWLHRYHAARDWALARLAAEVARSVIPLAGLPRALRHLFELPMPDHLHPLLRTLSVLHLAGVRSHSPAAWMAQRDDYVQARLREPKKGQLNYYKDKLAGARSTLKLARVTFYIGSGGALIATTIKLSHVGEAATTSGSLLGFVAVMLPVVAVAALSLAAAFDLEARCHTFHEMLEFLEQQTPRLESAATENEFATLALQTEARLLGETANWYARRAFTGVA